MEKLNLPEYALKTRRTDGVQQIWDPVRKKYLVLTPEEWVRQNFLMFLIKELGYPLTLMKHEGGVKYNGRQKRTDILAYDSYGDPVLLVECKASYVKIDSAVFEQAAIYNKQLKAKYLAVTNGLQHFCCQQDFSSGKIHFFEELPHYTRKL